MNKLEQILNLQNQPFMGKSNQSMTKQDVAQFEEYYQVKEEIANQSKLLRKNDMVLFIQTIKIKDNKASFGFRLKYKIVSGKIYKPLYTKKRSRFGETDSIPTIQVETDTHIIEISPEDVIKK